ncbi:hypothetical protein MLD38_015502 [Melastoma candidum]|uniref:Uncharacterized protein n=1 Tax=Melastoma candidum TaxID=119954 RepID=A0ACB9RFY8_9MYRT|nr:hypothetical protein MLD38_015502 [Melastoma candidum]
MFRNGFRSAPLYSRLDRLLLRIESFSTIGARHVYLSPDESRVLCCLSSEKFQDALNLLDEIPDKGRHGRVGRHTSLLSKLCTFRYVREAESLFRVMPYKNAVTYNAMITGFIRNGRLGDARVLFDELGKLRNAVTWTTMLSGYTNERMMDEAWRIFRVMPERNVVSWNVMMVGLIRNGELEKARRLFDEMETKSIVSWNTMISGYVEEHRMKEARELFEEMDEKNEVTWTTMVAGYCKNGNVREGYNLFREMPKKSVVSWTAIISGFTWNGMHDEALRLFLEMKRDTNMRPNEETFISMLYACAGVRIILLGKQVHALLVISGMESGDLTGKLPRSLINMYSMFGMMECAHYIFSKSSMSCSVSCYNLIINGYIRIGQLESAQRFFDAAPFQDKISWTSLISAYLSVGQTSDANNLFNKMPDRDSVAWTAMISGYVHNELISEAIVLFSRMRNQGIIPQNHTYSCLLGAAGAVAYLDQGQQFHSLLVKSYLVHDLTVQNSLISMYAKCGKINEAHEIFSMMTVRDTVSWNSMIMGFANHGFARKALRLLEEMKESDCLSNETTFLGVLSACSHAGLVQEGLATFKAMICSHRIPPGPEHYTCMMDLLGRTGQIQEVEDFVTRLPIAPNTTVWGTLLGLCGLSNNFEIGSRAAKTLLQLDPMNAPGHTALCNIYAANGLHSKEKLLRREMGLKGVRKFPGCSWVSLQGQVRTFLSRDKLPAEAREMLLLAFRANNGDDDEQILTF